MNYVKLDAVVISQIADAVIGKLQPVLLGRFDELDGRLAKVELAVAPITGRTIHDMHGHLAVSAVNVERIADSYEKLTELLDLAFANKAAHNGLMGRVAKVETEVRELKSLGTFAEEPSSA
jgi:hypothetical protein